MRYRKWLWWTRFGMMVMTLQFVVAIYVMYIILKDISKSNDAAMCFFGQDAEQRGWKKILMICFLVLIWVVVIIQCITGSDVLRWRSFYATHDSAWKAHYREVFDHGIREALCCMGRVKYLSVLEEDEVYSVARLLGDLVAYRASGTGHFDLLAGLALLQKRKKFPELYGELIEAPEARIQEAALFHRYSEAAYTGPLLDFGRNPVLFPCAWLHRQGILTPWTRSRRPALEGDNWWRGHAAAFLKCINLPPEALRKGRVRQRKREVAYFVVALHHHKSVLVAVRGTETPEDLLTDGLCRECNLSLDDLDGLINSDQLAPGVRETVLSTFPHYGHSGIVESARELFEQLDGLTTEEDESPFETPGFLSSLLGNGSDCQGYRVIIVGHSLGGAIATLLGVRLYARYPNLHVYAYGPLPCTDMVIAEACSDFVTSIVYNDEFSSRLSVNSILRLRASAIAALSDDSSTDSAIISKLARRILSSKRYQENRMNEKSPGSSTHSSPEEGEDGIHKRRTPKHSIQGGIFLCGHTVSCLVNNPNNCASSRVVDGVTSEPRGLGFSEKGPYGVYQNQELYCGESSQFADEEINGIQEFNGSKQTFIESSEEVLFNGQRSEFMDNAQIPIEVSIREPPEVFLAGVIILIIPEERDNSCNWKSWIWDDRVGGYRAVLANREWFKDIVVSPFMFLDHLPWRCHYALQKVLETRKLQAERGDDSFHHEQVMV
ncbi:uncharacterized protein LOC109837578 isoform X1 [Asparagus officinalis]|uniref:uncharacterized protein LOC109837578 isoform X1 n=2 Tax=Asparagus officinalis TaxID=4686 RepID=UPI00098E3ABA|nr:uncharacterized protein LOC109837578 isoform X1 [Asparagus officinalis]XP_020261473.1 uncharacterized protein LOC109837578 isoform X1 [Asparagus officinalis]